MVAAAADEFSLDVKLLPGRNRGRGVWEAEILLPPEGDVTVRFEYLNFHLPATRIDVEPFRSGSESDPRAIEFERQAKEQTLRPVQRVTLDGEDRKALQQAIERSGFLGKWPRGEEVTDRDTWTVTARCGGAVKSREIYAQPEFAETEKVLWRLVRQAVGEWALSAGRQDILDYLLDDDRPNLLLHPERLPQRVPPAAPVKSACHKPECASTGGPAVPAAAKVGREEAAREAVATIRGPGSLTLDAEAERPVRGRMESQGKSSFVEVCVKEVAAAGTERPALVRFTMRLCSEDGTTNATELRPSERPGWNYDALPRGWSSDAVGGVPFHRFFEWPMGTGWDVDALAEVLEGGTVRFTVLGKCQCCTK